MVEQTNTGECHRHSVFVAHIDHVVVTDRSARLREILSTATIGGSFSSSEHANNTKTDNSPNAYIIFAFIFILHDFAIP